MKFKVGDKVICKETTLQKGDGWRLNFSFEVISITSQSSENPIYWKGINGNGIYETGLKLAKDHKPKAPTHLVIWEEDRDPSRLFTSEKEARDFIKELSDKSSVKKDSILLIEIKSCKKVSVSKSLRYNQHKI